MVEELRKRVLVLDGAMGTMIQQYGLAEEDFRGGLDLDSNIRYKGCNDLLCLSRPDVISAIHRAYLQAGADIIETNSFNANAISMAEYGLQPMVSDINLAAARLARAAVEEHREITGRRAYVAGSMGPTNVALSIPSSQSSAAAPGFDEMRAAYCEQASALIEGGVDTLLIETIFDTLNAKAAIAGAKDAMIRIGREVPLMLSVTLTESGRTLSGQSVEAFMASVAHAGAISVGLNCGFGAEGMAPWLEKLQSAPCFVTMHANAGLPDEMGQYTETPEMMAATMRRYLREGKLNVAGGCCGTTPDHIRAIAEEAAKARPRQFAARAQEGNLRIAGLEPLDINPAVGFIKVGERCNVAGSRKFLRLVNEGNLTEALDIASSQIGKGAKVLDINMDDAMLDAPAEMERFVTLLSADVQTAPLPLMIDSSDMTVIRRALRKIQGVAIVNSISLKEGEEKFISHAREIRELGGVVVVMAFDEEGQATTLERRIAICSRAYALLTKKCGYRGEEIIFDPNVLTIATGVAEHDRYAIDFLDTISWIKQNLKGAKVSGGVSNLSFAFRGHNKLREAMHTIFLHHAILRGMDMAIVNPSTSVEIASIDPTLRDAIEDVIFCRRADATDRLLDIAAEMKAEADRIKAEKLAAGGGEAPVKKGAGAAKQATLESLVERGIDAGLEPLLEEAMRSEGTAMGVVKNRLMVAMQRVGDEFGAGRMFLPQVVRSASVMKRAIEWLTPAIERENTPAAGEAASTEGTGLPKFVIATVKGDVHDIGKNIVGVILKCSGFDVIDLGVMVEGGRIIDAVKDSGAKFVGLSGLITPSLAEMCEIARMLEKEGMQDVCLCVGGATTTDLHTAVKIAPLFGGVTLHTRDAAQLPVAASGIADPQRHELTAAAIRAGQEKLRKEYEVRRKAREAADANSAGKATAAAPAVKAVSPMPAPLKKGRVEMKIYVADAIAHINWRAFLHTWQLNPALASKVIGKDGNLLPIDESAMTPDLREARKVMEDALAMIERLKARDVKLDAAVALLPARRDGDDIVIDNAGKDLRIPTLRQRSGQRMAMVDFIAESGDYVGLFAVTARNMLAAMESVGKCPCGCGIPASLHGRAFGIDTIRKSGISHPTEENLQFSTDTGYESLLVQSLADRLVEAATEVMHTRAHEVLWGLHDTPRGIRPAVGYPSMPDQSMVFELDKALHYSEIGIKLTENGALYPSATTTGLIFPSSVAKYFDVGEITEEMLTDYANRRGLPEPQLRRLLGAKI